MKEEFCNRTDERRREEEDERHGKSESARERGRREIKCVVRGPKRPFTQKNGSKTQSKRVINDKTNTKQKRSAAILGHGQHKC